MMVHHGASLLAKNHKKLRLIDELRRFRRSHEFRAKFSLLTQSRSSKKDETEPSYERLSKHRTYAQKRPVHYGSLPWNTSQSSPFDGSKMPSLSPRGDLPPPAFFSLHPVHPFPPGDAGRGRRGNNNNNTMALPMGPVLSIGARGFPLNRSGSPPSL